MDASWPCPPRAPGLTLAHALWFEHVATAPVGTELGAIQLQHPSLRLVVQGDWGGGREVARSAPSPRPSPRPCSAAPESVVLLCEPTPGSPLCTTRTGRPGRMPPEPCTASPRHPRSAGPSPLTVPAARTHLAAGVPEGLRVIVAGVHPVGGRVDAGQLALVEADVLGRLLLHDLLGPGLAEG